MLLLKRQLPNHLAMPTWLWVDLHIAHIYGALHMALGAVEGQVVDNGFIGDFQAGFSAAYRTANPIFRHVFNLLFMSQRIILIWKSFIHIESETQKGGRSLLSIS